MQNALTWPEQNSKTVERALQQLLVWLVFFFSKYSLARMPTKSEVLFLPIERHRLTLLRGHSYCNCPVAKGTALTSAPQRGSTAVFRARGKHELYSFPIWRKLEQNPH